MEVLSIGEKIKRARIYRGYTLKDVCGNDISVSKLSCIENGKIEPEDWVLQVISRKINLDLSYLKQSVEEQIEENIKKILNNEYNGDIIEELKYNLRAAESSGFYGLAFDIMHMIFEILLKDDDLKSVQELIGEYYDLRNSSNDKHHNLIYYIDLAAFFYKNKEYVQASNYFSSIRERVQESENVDFAMLAESIFGEAMCKVKLKDYADAYEIASGLDQLLQYVDDKLKKAKMYNMMALLSLRMNKEKFSYYENLSYEMYEKDYEFKAEAIFEYGATMLQLNEKNTAVEYLNKALEIYPKENTEKLVRFMLLCIEELVDNGIVNESEEINENALNYSINLDNIKLIEKSYHLKAKILKQQDSLISAEMYMNLSLDALTKFGTKKQLYERYIEMGKMYFDMDNSADSLKYFTLALSLQKKL